MAVTLALLLPAVPAAADWKDDLRKVEEHLGEDRSSEALRIARQLTEDMVEELAPGEAAARAFGTLLALRALAEAAEGLEDDARFHWSMAEHFRPDLGSSNLARYGEGGRIITSWQILDDDARRTAVEQRVGAEVVEIAGEIEAPTKRERLEQPQYTRAARSAQVQGVVVVQTVIDRTGEVIDVRIVKSLHPGLDFRTAEAVRSWRFEPARLDGEPVPVYYSFTTNFVLQRIFH
ncbi:MAG TPA: energy transducer TonB [Thermoanaerobaculia bacterium]|nr:energy transducer TonB [Thermoanaerobaculia bacterium]